MYRKIKGGRKNIERPHNSVKIAVVELFRLRVDALYWFGGAMSLLVEISRVFLRFFTFNGSKAGNLLASCGLAALGQGNLHVVVSGIPTKPMVSSHEPDCQRSNIDNRAEYIYDKTLLTTWQNFD
jgi:hypothetical protein